MWQAIKRFFNFGPEWKKPEPLYKETVEAKIKLYGLNWKKEITFVEKRVRYFPLTEEDLLENYSSINLMRGYRYLTCEKTGRVYNKDHIVALKVISVKIVESVKVEE